MPLDVVEEKEEFRITNIVNERTVLTDPRRKMMV